MYVQIPADVSWGAFVKMCNKIDVSAMLRGLDPLKVHKVVYLWKVVYFHIHAHTLVAEYF